MAAIITAVDSIAVKICSRDTVFVGVGKELHVHTSTGSRVLPFRLRGKVHGIATSIQTADGDGMLLAYGEREFILLRLNGAGKEIHFKLLQRAQLSDWISAAAFLLNADELVLLTAHSVLLHISYKDIEDGQSCRIISKYSCSDKSTLYCGHLHGNIWEELIVFGGNAFGELLIWQPSNAAASNGKHICDVPLEKRLPVHNGVIFSIDYDAESKLLTTTSDDRSIRFWNVALMDGDGWEQCKIVPIASGYGHVARVFQGKILKHDGNSLALTVGEDSHCCLWRCTGELVWKRRLQFGAVIWNFEYDARTRTLFTVGSTGNLLAFNLHDLLENKLIHSCTNKLVGYEQAEYMAKAKFLTPHMLVGITSKNRLIYTSIKFESEDTDNMCDPWRMVSTDLPTYKCTVLEVHKDYVALCGFKRLTLLKYAGKDVFNKLYSDDILGGMVRAFHFLDDTTFLISDELGNCLLLRGDDLLLRYAIQLPRCKEPWTTSALLVADHLLLSNRLGNLLLYKLDDATAKFEHIDTLKQPHGNYGATTLQLQTVTNKQIFVRSAGHDGALHLLCISKGTGRLKSHMRTVVPLAWVENTLTIDRCELLLGFNDNHFVAWSQSHDVAVQVPCGGGHRCWHYSLDTKNDRSKWLHLLFIKNKMLQLHKAKLFSKMKTAIKLPLRNQWHVRPCNIAALIERKTNETTKCTLISAGDDNLIKISIMEQLDENNTNNRYALVQQMELHTHISNIRTLKVVRENDEQALLFSGGGRAQLCISRLNLCNFIVEELANYTLKPTQTQVEHVGYSLDPEMRIMSCDIITTNVSDHSSAYFVFLGCSDGFVRKLRITADFEIVPEIEIFYGNCVLQVRVVADAFVVVAGTTGILHFYDLQLTAAPFQLTHHASGVNALDTLWEAATGVLHVLTGGDDQAVTYSAINISVPMNVIKSLQLKSMHEAQVTAACLKRAPGGPIYAYTASIDQNLIKMNLTNEQVEQTLHTCVADIKGLCVNSDERCFLYGCGIQVYEMKS